MNKLYSRIHCIRLVTFGWPATEPRRLSDDEAAHREQVAKTTPIYLHGVFCGSGRRVVTMGSVAIRTQVERLV